MLGRPSAASKTQKKTVTHHLKPDLISAHVSHAGLPSTHPHEVNMENKVAEKIHCIFPGKSW